MKTKEITTSDLSDFGSRERQMLVKLLTAWQQQGLPDGFNAHLVVPMMNRNSGCVFLTNDEYQSCMMNGSDLEEWFNCPHCGNEGFKEDCQLNDDGCNSCHIDESGEE